MGRASVEVLIHRNERLVVEVAVNPTYTPEKAEEGQRLEQPAGKGCKDGVGGYGGERQT